MALVKFTIDGKECKAEEGKSIVEAATENGVFIPTLCNYPGIPPKGSCRICTVLIGGKPQTACTTKVSEGMEIKSNIPEIFEFRKKVVEILFAEGNHFCPSCEKSGNCELQALAYRFNMFVSSFPYLFPQRDLDASSPKLIKDHNRCILCKRCIRGIFNKEGKPIFAFEKRGDKVRIIIDPDTSKDISDDLAKEAMNICPVGALIFKGVGFSVPYGNRKYDKKPIGYEIENK
jgi:NADH dehydrogenase/NADH:ubiquinone oxidoreductase 75 kD subunit (chain G)